MTSDENQTTESVDLKRLDSGTPPSHEEMFEALPPDGQIERLKFGLENAANQITLQNKEIANSRREIATLKAMIRDIVWSQPNHKVEVSAFACENAPDEYEVEVYNNAVTQAATVAIRPIRRTDEESRLLVVPPHLLVPGKFRN